MGKVLVEGETAGDDVARGFPGLSCLKCGKEDSTSVHLETLEFSCSECEETTSLEDAMEITARWQRVLSWVRQAPPAE